MPSIAEIRQQYPQYSDMTDQQLGDALYKKFYSDMPRDEFDQKIGLKSSAIPAQVPVPSGKEIDEATTTGGYSASSLPSAHDYRQAAGAATGNLVGTALQLTAGMPGTVVNAMEKTAHALGIATDVPFQDQNAWIDDISKKITEKLSGPAKTPSDVSSREVGETAATVASLAPLALAAPEAAGAVGRSAIGLARKVTGGAAKTAAEELRGAAIGESEKAIGSQESKAAQIQQKVQNIGKLQRKILETQPAIAADRAQASISKIDPFRAKVLAQTRDRVRQAEADYRAAGATAQQAKDAVAEHDLKIKQAEEAVTSLEQQLLARPTTTAEQFGQALRNTTKSIADRFSRIRKRESGFDQAIASAGDQPRVPTGTISSFIKTQLTGIRNPTLERILGDIDTLVKTDHLTADGKSVSTNALSVQSAESLRGYLDSIIRSKMFKDQKVDKETLAIITHIKKDLVRSATEAWTPYREALAKWRILSRPLDIVERKGALKKVLDVDPVSTDYANTEAQVVGQVIQKARQGNPVFTRLLQENPDIKEPARLYFTQDLFSKGVPSPSSLKTWLKLNEGPLRQLGLYDEFRDIRVARETAQRAVGDAKEAKTLAVKRSQIASEGEGQAKAALSQAERLRNLARQRAEPERVPDQSETTIARRGDQAVSRLSTQAGQLQRSAQTASALADDFRKFRTELTVATPKEIPARSKAFFSNLRDKGLITDAQYADYLKQVQNVQESFTNAASARKRILYIGAAALAATGIWRGHRTLLDLMHM